MTGPTVVAIDIGTSSCRVGLFDASGAAVRDLHAYRRYALSVDPSGAAVLDVDELTAAVEAALDELVAKAGEAMRSVRAIGTSCFFHSLVGLDGAGLAVTKIRSWADTGSAAATAELRRRLDGAAVRERTGCELGASFWPAKIAAEMGRRRDARRPPIARWAGFADVLAARWQGRLVTSVSMASGTGLFDRRAGAWDGGLLAELGLSTDALPELVPDGQPLGNLVDAAARRWPSLAGLPWFAAWGDGACSNVGSGCLAADRAALMIGTSGAMRAFVGGEPPAVPAGLFAFSLDGFGTLLGGQLSEGGGVAAWLATLLGSEPRRLEDAAAKLEADGHGLTVLPFAAGERSLGYHADARGWVAGLSLTTTPADLYRAFLEAVALRFAAVDERLSSALGRQPSIVASGGGLDASPLWRQIIADALGRPIETSPVAEASSRGAALLALRHSATLEGPAMPLPAQGGMVEPSAAAHARYREALARQEALYGRVLDG